MTLYEQGKGRPKHRCLPPRRCKELVSRTLRNIRRRPSSVLWGFHPTSEVVPVPCPDVTLRVPDPVVVAIRLNLPSTPLRSVGRNVLRVPCVGHESPREESQGEWTTPRECEPYLDSRKGIPTLGLTDVHRKRGTRTDVPVVPRSPTVTMVPATVSETGITCLPTSVDGSPDRPPSWFGSLVWRTVSVQEGVAASTVLTSTK